MDEFQKTKNKINYPKNKKRTHNQMINHYIKMSNIRKNYR